VPAVIINIYLDGKRIKQLLTSRQGTFVLYLRYNKEYTLELVKKGFFIEKVVIDTKVSDKLVKEGGIDIAIDNDIPVFEIYPEIKAELSTSLYCITFIMNVTTILRLIVGGPSQ